MRKTHVLMCTHNGASYVGEQIGSILGQTLVPDAIHVHDFGSRDETVAVLEKLSETAAAAITVTRHADAPGASLSFFRALTALSSQISPNDIVFLSDQDDVWLPHKAATMTALFEARETPDFLAFHDVKVVDQALQEIRPSYYTGDPFSLPGDLAPERLLLANPVIGHTIAVSGSLIAKVVAAADFQNYLMHDWAIVLFASRIGRIEFVPEPLSLYRQHGANVLGAYKSRPLSEILRRVPKFAAGMVRQARSFVRDVEKVGARTPAASISIDKKVRKARSLLGACVVLAASAIANGPTTKRKLLAVYVLLHGLLGTGEALGASTGSASKSQV